MNLEPASATWSPDGRYLACTTQDKTVICWDVPSAATKWVGIGLAGGQVATLTANGTLIGEDVKVFDEQFVFAEQATTGQITPYTAGEFARLRNGRK
jgi:WD40 repeat protein